MVAFDRSEIRNATASATSRARHAAAQEAPGRIEGLDVLDGDAVRLGALAAELVRPELRAGEDRVGAHGVRPDAVPAALERRDPHQLDEARLRDRVRPEPGPRLECVLRRDVHEAAADPLLAQQRDGPAGEQELRGEVHLEAPLPHGGVELLDPAGGGDAGVEDDGVEAAEARNGGVDRAVDDGGVGEVARDRDRAVELLEPVLVDVRENEVGAACRQVASDLAADSRSRARDEDDVAGQLRRRRKQRQLAELERPGLEVLDLLVRQPARPSEAIERGGDRGVGVGRDLGARPRSADVGPGRDAAEAPDEEHPAVRLPILEPDDGAARPDPQHVVRRAAHRADPRGIRPVGKRSLRAVGREHHALLGGEPAAQPDEEALHGAAAGLRRVGSRGGQAQVLARPADELERELVGLLVGLPPGDETVVGKHDGTRAGELGDVLRELEPGPKIWHDDDIRRRAPRAPPPRDRERSRASRSRRRARGRRAQPAGTRAAASRSKAAAPRGRPGSARGRRPSPRRSSPPVARRGSRSSSHSPGKSAAVQVARSEPLPLIRSERRSRPR